MAIHLYGGFVDFERSFRYVRREKVGLPTRVASMRKTRITVASSVLFAM